MTRRGSRLRRAGLVAGALVMLVAIAVIAREPLFVAAGRALVVDDAVAPAEYLVVLGGDAENRPFAAAGLYRRGFAPRVLVFTHQADRLAELGLQPSHDALYQKVLELEGVPGAAIVRIPGIVDSSRDEAASLRRFLAAHPARRVILVTSAEHTRRARWVFRAVLAGLEVDVRAAAARYDGVDERNWWKHDHTALAYIHEYLKLPFYWLRETVRSWSAPSASS